MLTMSAASKAAAAVTSATAGAAAMHSAPAAASIWTILVLGLPLSVLAAALAGSAIRHLREPAREERKIVAAAVGTLADGFIGGWLAMFLIGVPITGQYIGSEVRPEVVGAICALLVQFCRDHGKGYFDRFYDAVLNRFFSRGAGGAARDQPGGEP